LIHRHVPDIPLIVGGSAFSLYAEELMNRLPEIDVGVFGEGEVAFSELLENLSNPGRVKDIFFRKNGRLTFTGKREWTPFDGVPSPRRDLVNIQKYTVDPTSIGVQTKRGCVLQCIHCSDTYLMGKQLRLRPPEKVVDEIESLVSNWNIKEIMFADQVFNIPLNHALDICREIKKRKLPIRWTAWFNEKFITDELLTLAKEAGCTMVSFCPDSVSDDVLKNLKKNITAKDLERAYLTARRFQLPISFNFMINGPGESIASIIKLGLFLLRAKYRLKGLLKLHGLFVVPMRIYPHTDLHKLALKEGIIDENDDYLLEARFYNPPTLSKYAGQLLIKISYWMWWIKHLRGKFYGDIRNKQLSKQIVSDKEATV
jgi:anaerobic magnesium-protoporphyrin IX monomethyl ester cyclase